MFLRSFFKRVVLAFAFIAAVAQTPVRPPRLYTYYMLPTDTAWQWKSVVVDPPLVLSVDNTGQAHISLPNQVQFSDHEIPTGAIDGVNRTFTLLHSPNPALSLHLTWAGVELTQGLDYILTSNTIVYTGNPSGGLVIATQQPVFTVPIIRFSGKSTLPPSGGSEVIGSMLPLIPNGTDPIFASYRY